jgi:hypothetical protein
MTAWKRWRLPTSLRRRVNHICAASRKWFRPSRKRWSARSLLGLESLEPRLLLDATPSKMGISTLLDDLSQIRNDVRAEAVTLVNAAQPSRTNTSTPDSMAQQRNQAWTTLTTDWNKTWQDIGQVEFDALGMVQEEFNTLLNDLGIEWPEQSPSLAPPADNSSASMAAASPADPTGAAAPLSATFDAVKKAKPLSPPSPPPLPIVHFSPPVYSVTEGSAPSVTLDVALTALSAQPVSVQYTTSNGTATAGKDYTTTSGTLTIPANQGGATIVVPLLDDNAVNEPSTETFYTTLSNPSGATLDNSNVATINIFEDSDGGSNLPAALVPSPCSNDG